MAWRFYIDRNDFQSRLTLRGGDFRDGHALIVKPLAFDRVEDHDGGAYPDAPIFDMRAGEARALLQALVDECWQAAIRPTGVDDFRRVNDAQGRHLNDMRALVAKLTGTTLP